MIARRLEERINWVGLMTIIIDALMGSAPILMRHFKEVFNKSVPASTGKNPSTSLDIEITVAIIERTYRPLTAISKELGCDFLYLAEEAVFRNEMRRRLPYGAFRRLVPPVIFFAEDNGNTIKLIFDGLDGTSNFQHGLSPFCLAAAVLIGNKPRLSVIYEPHSKQLFCAYVAGSTDNYSYFSSLWNVDTGFRQNLTRLPRHHKSLDQVGVGLHLTRSEVAKREEMFPIFYEITRQAKATYLHNCGIMSCVQVALNNGGHGLGAFVNNFCFPWDILPAIALLQATNCLVTDFEGKPLSYHGTEALSVIVSSNGAIHKELLAIVAKNAVQTAQLK